MLTVELQIFEASLVSQQLFVFQGSNSFVCSFLQKYRASTPIYKRYNAKDKLGCSQPEAYLGPHARYFFVLVLGCLRLAPYFANKRFIDARVFFDEWHFDNCCWAVRLWFMSSPIWHVAFPSWWMCVCGLCWQCLQHSEETKNVKQGRRSLAQEDNQVTVWQQKNRFVFSGVHRVDWTAANARNPPTTSFREKKAFFPLSRLMSHRFISLFINLQMFYQKYFTKCKLATHIRWVHKNAQTILEST